MAVGKLDDAIATIKRAAADNKTKLVYTTLGLFLILKADETGDFSEASPLTTRPTIR